MIKTLIRKKTLTRQLSLAQPVQSVGERNNMNSKSTPVLIVLLVVASFLIGKFYTENQFLKGGTAPTTAGTQATPAAAAQQQQPPTVKIAQVKDAFSKSLIKFGDVNSKLVMLEISDPSCPYCHVAAGLDGTLNKQMGSQFTLVSDGGSYIAPVAEMKKLVDAKKASFAWIYYPGHGAGEMATKAMYCAFDAGKFWEVHDKIMTNDGYNLLNNTVKNDKTKSGDLAQYLSGVFDPTAMKTCLDSGKYDSRLQTDQGLATALAIQGTPGFFVNEKNFAGAYSYADMKSTVDSALQ